MIKDFRDMMDFFRAEALGIAQYKIPVLAAFVTFPETVELAEAFGAENREVAEVVLCKKEIRIPIGFEVGGETFAVRIDFIAIGVKEFEAGILSEG